MGVGWPSWSLGTAPSFRWFWSGLGFWCWRAASAWRCWLLRSCAFTPTCTVCSPIPKVCEPFWGLSRKRERAALTAPANPKTHTKGEYHEYHCADQYRPAKPGYRAPTSAPERYGLGTASLSRQPPLLAASPRLLLSLVLRDMDPADTTHAQSPACQGAVHRLRCWNQRLGTSYDPSLRNVDAAGYAPALCQCGWRDAGSLPTHPRTAHGDRAADLGVCLGTLPDMPVAEPGAGAAVAGLHPGDGLAFASNHHRLSVARDRQSDGHLDRHDSASDRPGHHPHLPPWPLSPPSDHSG